MAKNKKEFSGFIFIFLLWLVNLAFSYWYFSTGWSEPNAIMEFCSKYVNSSVWYEVMFYHGALNWTAGTLAVYGLAAPIVFLVIKIRHKNMKRVVAKLTNLFLNILLAAAFGAALLYGAIFLMDEKPLIAGILGLLGICMIIPVPKTLLVVVIED